jgi:hypothetical protein
VNAVAIVIDGGWWRSRSTRHLQTTLRQPKHELPAAKMLIVAGLKAKGGKR